jgi:hypothetical protein
MKIGTLTAMAHSSECAVDPVACGRTLCVGTAMPGNVHASARSMGAMGTRRLDLRFGSSHGIVYACVQKIERQSRGGR